MLRVLKYVWFFLAMKVTGWLPDFAPVLRLRGLLVRPCFHRCGRNFQICSTAMVVFPSRVTIGNDVFIGYGCWLHGAGGIELGDEVMLGPYTVVVSITHTRSNRSFRFGELSEARTVLKRGAWTGANAVVTAGCTIGEGALVGAGAVVTGDIPPDCLCAGVPARVIRRLDQPACPGEQPYAENR